MAETMKICLTNLFVDNFQGTDKKSAEQKAQIAKAKVVKDTKSIPTLVFKIETFEKNLIKLSQKTKNKKLLGNTKLSVARDCRIRLENIVNNGDENETENRGNSIQQELFDQKVNLTNCAVFSDDHDETKENEEGDEEMSIDGENAVAESTRIDSVLATQDSNTASSQNSESQPSQPPNKKLKIKMGFNKVQNFHCLLVNFFKPQSYQMYQFENFQKILYLLCWRDYNFDFSGDKIDIMLSLSALKSLFSSMFLCNITH